MQCSYLPFLMPSEVTSTLPTLPSFSRPQPLLLPQPVSLAVPIPPTLSPDPLTFKVKVQVTQAALQVQVNAEPCIVQCYLLFLCSFPLRGNKLIEFVFIPHHTRVAA